MGLEFIEDTENSILAAIAGFISPIFIPVGLGDWRLVTSLISGFIMKESVVATMAVLFSGTTEIFTTFSPIIACSFLVFCLLYTPCVAAIACARREVGTLNAFLIIILQCLVA